MFKRKGKSNKENLGLLEEDDCSRVSMENWQPLSQQEQVVGKTLHSKEDQRILSMGIQRPQREDWKTFSKNNPFEELPGVLVRDNSYNGEVDEENVDLNVSIVNSARCQQTQVSHNQTFSCDNLFFGAEENSFGNPLNVKTTTTFTINQTVSAVPQRSRNFFSGRPGEQYPSVCKGSSFDPIKPLAPTEISRRISLPRHQQGQNDCTQVIRGMSLPLHPWAQSNVQQLFDEIHPGKQSHSKSSSSETEKESSSEVQKKKKKKKKKKSKKSKKSKSKTKKKVDWETDNLDSSELEGIAGAPISREKKKKKKKTSDEKTEALAELLRGTALLKFPRRGRSTPHFKFFQLTRRNSKYYLQWFSKKKSLKTTTISIESLDDVLQGNQSDVIKRFEEQALVEAAFSIKCCCNYSLDLVAKNAVECTMWVKCLKELILRAKKGTLASSKECWIRGIKFLDKNRPQREMKDISIDRPNKAKGRQQSDSRQHEKNNMDVQRIHKRYQKLKQLSSDINVRSSFDYNNLMVSLTALEDRLEELVVETKESRDFDWSKKEIWRYTVDFDAVEEKVKVLQQNKNFHFM